MATHSHLAKPFADTLRRVRLEQGIAQEELAAGAGIHRTYVSQLERGLKSPTLTTIEALADVLGYEPAELISMAQVAAGKTRRHRPTR